MRIRTIFFLYMYQFINKVFINVTKIVFSLRADSQEAFAHWELFEGTSV